MEDNASRILWASPIHLEIMPMSEGSELPFQTNWPIVSFVLRSRVGKTYQ